MKVESFLKTATAMLESAGIGTARLDTLILLEDVLNTDRTQLLAHPEIDITGAEQAKLNALIQKRVLHTPLAYLRGKTEFYGREFIVNEHVLEPRPESETMIDMLIGLSLQPHSKLLDVGCGSGALGITAALEIPQLQPTLLDLDEAALAVTKLNSKLHDIPAHFIHNDLLDNINEHFEVLLCNLPYVPDDYHINTSATHEPRLAIFGGADGLDLFRRLFTQLATLDTLPSYVLTESLPAQHDGLTTIARDNGYKMASEDDFIQLFVPAG